MILLSSASLFADYPWQMLAARRSIGRQFILITPGTKTDITISPDVRVKELAEPERGQTTLNFRR